MKEFKATFFVLLALCLFMLLPDIIYSFINHNYLAGYDVKSISINLLLMVFVTLSRAHKLNLAVLTVLAGLQATQLMYFQYFGGFYSAFDIVLMMGEAKDASLGFIDASPYMIAPFLTSLISYGVALYVYGCYQKKKVQVPYISALLVLVLVSPFIQSISSEASQKFQPNISQSSVKNGLYSVSFFMARQIKVMVGERKKMPTYASYEMTEHKAVDANIVVLMGESLNYYNLGLFGYERNTTPDLTPYTQNPEFFYTPALSSAVSTRVSLSLFFNTVYEPNNTVHLSKMETSLYRIAKKSGFNTHYITTQKNAGGLTYSFSLQDIDTWKEDKHLNMHEGNYDDRLLKELQSMKLDYNQPQFITLHMRSAHIPYVANYPKAKEVYPVEEGQDFENYMINSYDNSILYTQKVITDIYEFFKNNKKPTYVFFIPDHGELLGQGGRFGHNSVDIDMARVPFFFYGPNLPLEEIESLKQRLGCMSNHYLISKEISSLLGVKIFNPNEIDGQYYLNGTDVFGEAGYLAYDLKEIQRNTCGKF